MNLDISKDIFVISSKLRRKIVVALNTEMTPTEIYKKVKEWDNHISFNNVSNTLTTLKKKGIVVCINEEQKRGRLYKLTKEGQVVREKILKLGIRIN